MKLNLSLPWRQLFTPYLFLAVLVVLASLPMTAEEAVCINGEKIFDRYIEATGGIDAYKKLTNRKSHSTVEIVGAGLKLDLTVYSAMPNKAYVLIESDMTGKIESGTDGDIVWENSLMTGPQIKEGKERENLLRDNRMDRLSNWREFYKEVNCEKVMDVNEKPAFQVMITPFQGEEQTFYFDVDSGLIVRIDTVVENQMGTFPIEAYLSDYKRVDGVLFPFLTKVVVMGQERLVTTDSIEHNVEMDEKIFEVPEEIIKLMKSAEEKEAVEPVAGEEAVEKVEK